MNIESSSQPILPVQFDVIDCKTYQFYGSNNDVSMIIQDKNSGLGTDLGLLFLNPNSTDVKIKAIFRYFLSEEIEETKEFVINRNYVTCLPLDQKEGERKICIRIEQLTSDEPLEQSITLIFPANIPVAASSKYEIFEGPYFDKDQEERLRNQESNSPAQANLQELSDSPAQTNLQELSDSFAQASLQQTQELPSSPTFPSLIDIRDVSFRETSDMSEIEQDPLVREYLNSLMETAITEDDFPNYPISLDTEISKKMSYSWMESSTSEDHFPNYSIFPDEDSTQPTDPLSDLTSIQSDETKKEESKGDEFDYSDFFNAEAERPMTPSLNSLDWDPTNWTTIKFEPVRPKDPIKTALKRCHSNELKYTPNKKRKVEVEVPLEVSPEHLDIAFERFLSEVNKD